jgi:ferri-bacillibactin esterase
MRLPLMIIMAALGLAPSSPTQAQGPLPGAKTAPVAEIGIEGWRRFDFTSAVNGTDYRVLVYTPRKAPPAGGFPVLYVLDGDALFGTFAEAVRSRSQAGEIEPAVVVGVSGAPGPRGGDRSYDFSPTPLSDEEKTLIKDLGTDSRFGGAEPFLQVIQTEIRPRVAEMAGASPTKSILVGWSLGGLFVLHTLFNHPETFAAYAALSPSIWWNDKVVLRDIPAFEQKIAQQRLAPRIYIGVGGLEQTLPTGAIPQPFTRESMARELRHARMVDNARELSETLSGQWKRRGLLAAGQVFEQQTRDSMPWAATNPVLEFALPRESPAAR